jgi:hypothetical protein
VPIFATRNAVPSVPFSPIASLIHSAADPVGSPVVSCVQVVPLSVLLYTPLFQTPAYNVVGVSGSSRTSET